MAHRVGRHGLASPATASMIRPRRARAVIDLVLEHPELVAAFRQLSPESFLNVVASVGLESAGDLVALATAAQLEAAFDEELWTARDGAVEEQFDADRFALWLEILFEAGEEAVVRRLVAMSEDLLTLAVQRLVLVVDIDALALQLSEGEAFDRTEKALDSLPFEEWEEFRLIGRSPGSWETLWEALLALDREHHGLLRRVLERCAALTREAIDEGGDLYEVLSLEDMLEGDVRSDRDERRVRRGHVSAADARSFLALAKSGADLDTRDAVTRAYFRGLGEPPASSEVPEPMRASEFGRANPLTPLLETAGLVDAGSTGPALLEAKPEDGRHAAGRDLLRMALGALRRSAPHCHAQRLEELGFLTNVVMAGLGMRESSVDAFELVAELVGIGVERAVGRISKDDEVEALAMHALERIPTDRLFRSAYHAALERPGDTRLDRARRMLEQLGVSADGGDSGRNVGDVVRGTTVP